MLTPCQLAASVFFQNTWRLQQDSIVDSGTIRQGNSRLLCWQPCTGPESTLLNNAAYDLMIFVFVCKGVALSASKLGVDNIIVMPTGSPTIKVDAVKKFGGNVLLHGANYDEAQTEALRLVEVMIPWPKSELSMVS